MLKRKIYNQLLDWKTKSKGRTALLIEGARRVGKSYIAELFGKNEYKSYILINFSVAEKELINILNLIKVT
jgi:predicted AAA+ superfamily ATPase